MAVHSQERTMAKCMDTQGPRSTEADSCSDTSVPLVDSHKSLAKVGKHIGVARQLIEQAMRCFTPYMASRYATIPTTS